MKVLWLCNIMLPAIARELNLPFSNREGWLTGTYERFIREQDNQIELGICYPVSVKEAVSSLKIGRVKCYGFREDLNTPEKYDKNLEEQFRKILEDFKPDVVHIFGTEFPHARALVKVWDRSDRILLGVQGMCYKIAEVYTRGLPENVVRRVTFRDLIRRDSLRQQQQKFVRRGKYEKEVIAGVNHITGRTGFDRKCVAEVHPKAIYHHMNETMRDCFYSGKWESEKCQPGSIFLSQGDYPVKGFHYMLQAMPAVLKKNPSAHLYVAGNSIIEDATWKDKLKVSSYGKYLQSLMKEYGLEDRITILGKLDGEAMKEQFLRSSVFVCPSVIENSPNAVSEAMLLGMPVVAAAVGGIPDMIEDGEEGLLYEAGDVTALAEAIGKAWEQETALKISAGAAKRAAKTHDRNINYERLMEIYYEINLYF